MSGLVWLGFVAACSLGTAARYLVDGYIRDRTAGRPWGIWAINVSGSFLLGLLVGSDLGSVPLLIAGTGFCGAYTTFSTFAYETVVLAEEGRAGTSVLNVGGSIAGGLAAAGLGIWLGGL
jgi:fluoride exporter